MIPRSVAAAQTTSCERRIINMKRIVLAFRQGRGQSPDQAKISQCQRHPYDLYTVNELDADQNHRKIKDLREFTTDAK